MIKKKWVKISNTILKKGVEMVKIDGDLIEDVIELRDKEYLESIKQSRLDAYGRK